jgi:hypothetical protein
MSILPNPIATFLSTGKATTRQIALSELGPDFPAKAVALEALIATLAHHELHIELQFNSYVARQMFLSMTHLTRFPGSVTRLLNDALDNSTAILVFTRTTTELTRSHDANGTSYRRN